MSEYISKQGEQLSEEIKFLGMSLRAIAREGRVSITHLRDCIAGRRYNPSVVRHAQTMVRRRKRELFSYLQKELEET